jgi:hypothetical protein
MEGEESNDENKYRCKIIVKPEEIHFQSHRLSTVETDELKENIRLKIWYEIVDHAKGMNGDKMVTNGTV